MEEKLLTVKEVAGLLQVDEQTVYRNKEMIGYTKLFGRQIRFKKEDVDAYVKKVSVKPEER